MKEINLGGNALKNGVRFESKNGIVVATNEHNKLRVDIDRKDESPSKFLDLVGKILFVRVFLMSRLTRIVNKKYLSFLILLFVDLAFLTILFDLSRDATGWITKISIINVAFIIVPITVIFIYVIAGKKSSYIKEMFKYHGAEHTAVQSYEINKKLILEEVDISNTYHPRCGSNYLVLLAVFQFIFLIMLANWIPVFFGLLIANALAYESLMLFSKVKVLDKLNFFGRLFQKHTVLQPEKLHLQTGVAAALTIIAIEKGNKTMKSEVYEDFDDFLKKNDNYNGWENTTATEI